ncbi:MAG: Gfo/Idh/MocA family protein, partial [Candidatus Njordarchaeales archaeon]
MKKFLKVGVIGVGTQGENHIKSYQSFRNVRIEAIADLKEERVKKIAERYNIKNWYTDYEEMLELSDLDAVSIVTPDFLHKEPALAAINAGKHVLIEKPLATTVQDAEAIVNAAKKMGVKLMVCFISRWRASVLAAKEFIDKGELGNPVYAYARINDTIYVPTKMLATWSSKTSLPFWLMSHTIDRVRWLFNSEIKRVYAISSSSVLVKKGITSPDLFHATLEFENGALGAFESCWILPETLPFIADSYMELIYDRGYMDINLSQNSIKIATQKKYFSPDFSRGSTPGSPIEHVTATIGHFIECVLEDKEPEASGEDGLAVVKICSAIVKSAQERKPIELSLK